jgi:hypothetical protein
MVKPKDIDKNELSMLTKKLWEKEVDCYLDRINELDLNLHHLFAVIYGQCSYNLQTRLILNSDYISNKKKSECGWLHKEIK